MAKNGLDYFPFVCQQDDKLDLIEAEFGLRGLAIILKLFQRIYGEQGYYCNWNEEVALLFSRKVCGFAVGDNVVSELIHAALRRNLFSQEKYDECGILTSAGIQKRFFEAAKRRIGLEVFGEYLLIDVDQVPKNVNIIYKNVCRNNKNADRKQQRKVKESRVKEREEKTFSADCFAVNASKKLRDGLLRILPHQRVPDDSKIDTWAIHIDYMLRLDKRTEDDINALIDFALSDSFWQTNIRSTAKLREKQDTLYAQMMRKSGKIQQKTNALDTVNKTYEDIERRRKELGL